MNDESFRPQLILRIVGQTHYNITKQERNIESSDFCICMFLTNGFGELFVGDGWKESQTQGDSDNSSRRLKTFL
ncbi:unnamed protein product [Orchesella dallaii]|uniref:Uncharacterized protein n=1 Tax=Orchesella dallaii TaxID=48710 RepID=A0ABP1QSD6_9HEXA